MTLALLPSLLLAVQPLMTPDVVRLLVVIVILGVCLWLIQTYVPMAAPLKTLLTIVVVLVIVLWLLRTFALI
jgi:hypothetical protein